MKQLLQNLRTGETFVDNVPVPAPKPGTVLVRTAASLVSAGTERMLVEFGEKNLLGKARSRPDLARQVIEKARRDGVLTTLEAAFSRLDQPLALGYSSAGTITAVGEGVQGWRAGQRVACAGGGYAVHAEYAVIPENLLALLPDGVNFESAAFTTLGAIALHGFRLSEAGLGDRVAVIGLGLVGLLAVGIARAAGCAVFGIDLDPGRVELATQLGAGQAVLRDQAEDAAASFSRAVGFDAVLICADTPSDDPVELAGAIARDRARVVAVGAIGLNLPRKIYYAKELTFLNSRSYGPGRYDPDYEQGGQDYPIGYVRWTEGRNLSAFVELLASNKLDVSPLVTHRFSIENAPAAYELITGKRQEPFLGVLLTYPPDSTGDPATKVEILENSRYTSTTQVGQEKVRLGVLGAGNFATSVLLPALEGIPTIERVGIASASGLNARHAAQRFHFGYACTTEEQILADPAVNTVAILTRHNLHARQVIAALQAGKHVFCEKPLALNLEELQAIADVLNDNDMQAASHPSGSAPRSQKPLLTVGFNRRFSPLAVRLKSFIDQRQEPFVALYRVNAGYLPPDHWLHDPRQGGGRLIGEACHFIDFLSFLAGAPPLTLSAAGLPDQGRYREDNLLISLTFPDGSIGSIAYLANGDRAFPKERLEVFTSGWAAVLDDFRSLELVQNGKRSLKKSPLRQDKGHHAEWVAFSNALSSGGPPPIPYDQLFGVSRAAIAAVEALHRMETLSLR
jgi:predicted dehydrogenase/threonine dehydrogenase-like Zn-dependent dehydrogenase